MQARMQQFLDHQNPAAEQEANEIAASVSTARTPQEVKAQLGERMGADFSNVRFHTGSDALQRAEGIGARAYATGRDIYFGEGGSTRRWPPTSWSILPSRGWWTAAWPPSRCPPAPCR